MHVITPLVLYINDSTFPTLMEFGFSGSSTLCLSCVSYFGFFIAKSLAFSSK